MGEPVSLSPARYILWALLVLVGGSLVAALSMAKLPDRHAMATKSEPARSVTPQIDVKIPSAEISKTQENTVELQRVEPRAPLSAIAAPTPPALPKPVRDLPKRWRPVGNGYASAAGIIQAGSVSITLDGLDTLTAEETCTAPSGQEWPCGMVARTAFRAYLRSRTLKCDLQDGLIDTAISAECLLAGDDPAKWLIQNGWARATVNGPYVNESEQAKAFGRGIFGPPPH